MQCFLKILKGEGLLCQNKVPSQNSSVQSKNVIFFWTFMAISATYRGHSLKKKKSHKGVHTKNKGETLKNQVNKCISLPLLKIASII